MTFVIEFEKGARSRLEEELLSSSLLLIGFAGATGAIHESDVQSSMKSLLSSSEQESFQMEIKDFGDPIERLLNGSIRCVEFCGMQYVLDAPRRGVLLLPGAFNPLHEGHLKLLEAAEQATGQRGSFELSVLNPDKETPSAEIIRTRLEQFSKKNVPILLTRAPLFKDKAKDFHKCTFVVGYDTAVRIIHPKYYGDDESNMMVELGTIRHHGCQFLVAGRSVDVGGDKEFHQFEDIQFPPAVQDLFSGLKDFRMDVSSTEIRQRLARSSA